MSKARPLPSQSYLKECFTYHEDGFLIRNSRPRSHFNSDSAMTASNNKNSGKVLLAKRADGSILVTLGNRFLRAHRVIYKMFHDQEPDQIDHINGDPSDNRIANLRAATNQQNSRNSKTYASNATGFKGVAPIYRKGELKGYTAQITIDYKKHHIGVFANPEDAHEAYKIAAKEAFGKFWCNGERND